MSKNSGIPISQAFSYSLRQLAIDEFPCGNGRWRSGNRWRCDAPDLLNPFKEQNAESESIQSLLEMMENEPFKTDLDWSEDCDRLRKIAIKDPEKITKENIFLYFTKLRLVDKNITEVDDILLKFKNLKDLILSANWIQNIDLKNLPKKLEVLELYGNKISSFDQFCCSLPVLTHIGLGSNTLTTINGAIHKNCWNHILSMDLSFNGLTSLNTTLHALKNLPTLSNLLLIGNPLFLASCYRGVVIDTLKQLTVLDDTHITADEKHRYKGISKIKDVSVEEAIFEINLSSLKGIKSLSDLENDNSSEESPRIEYRYQISYPFLLDCTVKKSQKTICEMSGSEKGLELNPENEDRPSTCETDDEIANVDSTVEDQGNCFIRRKTKERAWCEDEIKIDYERILITTDLTNLKRFLLEGLRLELIENKVVVSLDSPDDGNSVAGDREVDKGNKGSKSKATQKEKPKQPAASKTNVSKNRRKTKGEMAHLYELSRESKVIGALKIPLDDFVQGRKFFEKQCTILMELPNDNESEVQQEELKESKTSNMKKPASLDGKKKGRDLKKPPSLSGQRTRSAMSSKANKGEKQEKISKAKDMKTLGEIAENDPEPPSEITLDVVLTLQNWKTTKEAENWVDATQ